MGKYVISNLYLFEKRIDNGKKLIIGNFKRGNFIVTSFFNVGLYLSSLEPYFYTRDELGKLVSVCNPLIREVRVEKQLLGEKYINLYDYMRNNEEIFSINLDMNYFLKYGKYNYFLKEDIVQIEDYINKVNILKK